MEKSFDQLVTELCNKCIKILIPDNEKIRFRPMRRKGNVVNMKHGYVLGRTNLRTGLITIDVLTPKERKPKKISSILRTLCHEIAHHQKMPFHQRYKRKWIIRQHYPEFYDQVKKNIEILRSKGIYTTEKL